VSALEQIQFDSDGLIPAIAQDFETGEIFNVCVDERRIFSAYD
jgi:hypothetical protein